MKKLIINAAIYFGLGLGCIIGADYISNPVWHDSLLVIGGVCLGGLCAMVTLIEIRVKRGKAEATAKSK